MCSVLNWHNVAKYTESYLGQLRFYVTANGNAGCFKKSFTILKAYINLLRGHVQFNVTFTGNAACFKKSFIMLFQMLLCGECYENVYT
jgi:hypothetical protein